MSKTVSYRSPRGGGAVGQLATDDLKTVNDFSRYGLSGRLTQSKGTARGASETHRGSAMTIQNQMDQAQSTERFPAAIDSYHPGLSGRFNPYGSKPAKEFSMGTDFFHKRISMTKNQEVDSMLSLDGKILIKPKQSTSSLLRKYKLQQAGSTSGVQSSSQATSTSTKP